MRIELHPVADQEFASQVAYYEDQEPGLGQRFYAEVISHLDRIAANPELPSVREGYRRVNLKLQCRTRSTMDSCHCPREQKAWLLDESDAEQLTNALRRAGAKPASNRFPQDD